MALNSRYIALFHVILILSTFASSAIIPEVANSNDSSVIGNSSITISLYHLLNESHSVVKDDTLSECLLFQLDPDEFVILSNGSAHVAAYNRTYDVPFYLIVDEVHIRVCSPQLPDEDIDETLTSLPFTYISIASVAVSIICLLMHFIAFVLVSDLRNLPGCTMCSMCVSLFLSYVFTIVGQSQLMLKYSVLCEPSGILTQFFFMSTFLWMLVIAFDVCRTIFLSTKRLKKASKKFHVKKFVLYNVFVYSIAAVFVVAAVVADHVKETPRSFKPMFYRSCWFEYSSSLMAFFAVPVAVIISVNFLLFALSACLIFSNRMKSMGENQTAAKKKYLLYLRLSLIMGVTWITGMISPIFNAVWAWYLFTGLNALQGLFIFLAFTCTSKVRKYFRTKFCMGRKASVQSAQAVTSNLQVTAMVTK